jgi:hypothetical protein
VRSFNAIAVRSLAARRSIHAATPRSGRKDTLLDIIVIHTVGGAMRMPSTTANRFNGTWCNENSVVQYSLSIQGDPIVVTGIDTSDGEELRIQDATFDGSELRFTSICPSTSFALRHVFRSVLGDEVEHENIRVENWHRKVDHDAQCRGQL